MRKVSEKRSVNLKIPFSKLPFLEVVERLIKPSELNHLSSLRNKNQ